MTIRTIKVEETFNLNRVIKITIEKVVGNELIITIQKTSKYSIKHVPKNNIENN